MTEPLRLTLGAMLLATVEEPTKTSPRTAVEGALPLMTQTGRNHKNVHNLLMHGGCSKVHSSVKCKCKVPVLFLSSLIDF